MTVPMKMLWEGADVETLPREKLIEIIGRLARDLDQQRDTTRSIIRISNLASQARARLE